MHKILMQDNTILEDEEDIKQYQSDVGVCNFFSITTRYDIAYATSKLRRSAGAIAPVLWMCGGIAFADWQ